MTDILPVKYIKQLHTTCEEEVRQELYIMVDFFLPNRSLRITLSDDFNMYCLT